MEFLIKTTVFKSREWAIAISTFGLIIVVICQFKSAPDEPRYKGRKILFWVEGIKSPTDSDLFIPRVMKIGQPAVPVLMGEFRRQNSQVRRSNFYRQAWTNLPGSVQTRLPPPLSAAGTMPALAYTLGLLGPAARDSVPVLASGAKNSNPTVRSYSIWAMGQIGGDKAEAAVACYLLDADPKIRHEAESASNMISFRKRAFDP